MTTLQDLLLLTHLLGMAALVGGYFAALKHGAVNSAMVWGARAQLLTGLGLVGLAEAQKWTISHGFVGVKLVVAFLALALVEIATSKAKKGQAAHPLLHSAGLLAIINVIVAVFWH